MLASEVNSSCRPFQDSKWTNKGDRSVLGLNCWPTNMTFVLRRLHFTRSITGRAEVDDSG